MALRTSTPKLHSGVPKNTLLQLGQDSKRYVNITCFNEKIYIHIREFIPSKTEAGIMVPMFTGVALSINQWHHLMTYTGMIDNQIKTLQARRADLNFTDEFAPVRLTDEADHYVTASLWKGIIKLHLRIFQKRQHTTNLIPSFKGITLSESEWYHLKDIAFKVQMRITEAQMQLNGKRTTQFFGKWNSGMSDGGATAEPPRKVLKTEVPSTPPSMGDPLITPNGLPLDWAPVKKPKLERQNAMVEKSDVDEFFDKWRAELDEVDFDNLSTTATVDEESFEERVNNCEGCQMNAGNQEAHYDGCLKSVIDSFNDDDGDRIVH